MDFNQIKVSEVYEDFPVDYLNLYLRFYMELNNERIWVDLPPSAHVPVYKNKIKVKALVLPNKLDMKFKNDDIYKPKAKKQAKKPQETPKQDPVRSESYISKDSNKPNYDETSFKNRQEQRKSDPMLTDPLFTAEPSVSNRQSQPEVSNPMFSSEFGSVFSSTPNEPKKQEEEWQWTVESNSKPPEDNIFSSDKGNIWDTSAQPQENNKPEKKANPVVAQIYGDEHQVRYAIKDLVEVHL